MFNESNSLSSGRISGNTFYTVRNLGLLPDEPGYEVCTQVTDKYDVHMGNPDTFVFPRAHLGDYVSGNRFSRVFKLHGNVGNVLGC